MTPNGPPKRAPKEIPLEAARYLDEAAARLSKLARERGLELKPYDQYHPDHTAWLHGIYGETWDREFCVQIVTDGQMASTFTALIKTYVRLHSKVGGEVVYPRGDAGDWLALETRRVRDMAGLMTGVSELTTALQLVCAYRMPHQTEPDPKC